MKGISFNGVHSYTDLNLVLSDRKIAHATPKLNLLDLPGGDGSVDLTEAQGEVKFNDREHEFVFTVFPSDDWEKKKTEVSNLVSGRKMKIVDDNDPGYYWVGRCFINEYRSDKNIHKISVGAIVAPYKYKNEATTITASAGVVTLQNSRKRVVPEITATKDAKITFNGDDFNLSAGTHVVPEIVLGEGDNQLTIETSGQVTFTYTEGDL